MKLASYDAGGGARIGIVKGDGLIDVAKALPSAPATMIGLIADWDRHADALKRIEAEAAPDLGLAGVRLLPPVPRPGKIMAIGLNYADHIAESGAKAPERQLWFAKMSSSANGAADDIQLPGSTSFVDYEAELVAIIGKGGRNIAKDGAAASVFGYCCGNDVTARDWQWATPQWVLGKSFDTHAPMGPYIVTADEVPDPHALGIRCFVNGEKRQDSNTANLVFNLWDQIAHLSQAMTLEPGDAIFTGTPGGVGMAMKPQAPLKAGDTVRVEIDGLGAIEAKMIAVP
jgi:2-keto-4-pentenoate hydratase/2-oxohepta-3-ene-1,7-dioic acid hydratase in catechol pathway